MTEKKPFYLKIKWKNREKKEALEIVLYDNGQPLCELISVDDAKLVKDILNEQDEQIKELELENAKQIGDGEWDIRDITYGHGRFRLEEWGERYHQFYDGNKSLEDEEVVSLLFENGELNERITELEKENENYRQILY